MISNGTRSERIVNCAVCVACFACFFCGAKVTPDILVAGWHHFSLPDPRYSIIDFRISTSDCFTAKNDMRLSIHHVRLLRRTICVQGLVPRHDWPLQLILRWVTDYFIDEFWVTQALTDHLHEEPFFPLGVAAIGIVMNVCVPAVSHAPPLDVQAWATNLSPFDPPRGVCVCVPPRLDDASADDCVATHSAGVRRLLLYLHSCRNLGDLF